MSESQARLDALDEVARAVGATGQPEASFAALDAAMGRVIGHKLFTILVVDVARRESARIYTNQPAAYPVGGRKPRPENGWAVRLLDQGMPYIGRTADDIRSVFFDHELILSLGCESVLNLPIRHDGQTLGTINMLHQANWYGEQHAEIGRAFAAMAIPAVRLVIARGLPAPR
jgi:hypothetical protein